MNIFVTSADPRACAQALDDLRLNKMIVESCQILCSALHLTGHGSAGLYKPAYTRHPVVLWTARDRTHYAWLFRHLEGLFEERAFRLARSEHRSLRLLPPLAAHAEGSAVPAGFENCTPYKEGSVYLAYQRTLNDKWRQDRRPPAWSRRGPPEFCDLSDRRPAGYSAASIFSSSAADRIGSPSKALDGRPSTPTSGLPTSVTR
jgi:hypothetical protein